MKTTARPAHVAGRKEVHGAWQLPLIQVVKVGHALRISEGKPALQEEQRKLFIKNIFIINKLKLKQNEKDS